MRTFYYNYGYTDRATNIRLITEVVKKCVRDKKETIVSAFAKCELVPLSLTALCEQLPHSRLRPFPSSTGPPPRPSRSTNPLGDVHRGVVSKPVNLALIHTTTHRDGTVTEHRMATCPNLATEQAMFMSMCRSVKPQYIPALHHQIVQTTVQRSDESFYTTQRQAIATQLAARLKCQAEPNMQKEASTTYTSAEHIQQIEDNKQETETAAVRKQWAAR
jgi:hypothetical protein